MRGNDTVRGTLFSYVDLEKRVRADHPLRVIRGRAAHHRGLAKIDWQFTLAMAAYNIVRLPKLLKAPA